MTIYTRLFFSFLPAILGAITLIAILLFHQVSEFFWISSISPIYIAVSGVSLIVALIMISLYFISKKISDPMQRLNDSALNIAAGQYGESIQLAGPKEFNELANTLNTMSQCLLENMNRLEESSLLKARIHGEAECARLLQHLMLQKNIAECSSDAIAMRAISFVSTISRGWLLYFPPSQEGKLLHIHLLEAKQTGLEGMYQLLTQYASPKEQYKKSSPFFCVQLTLDLSTSTLYSNTIGCSAPYLWSLKNQNLTLIKEKHFVEAGDFILFINQGVLSFFRKSTTKIFYVLQKVLKHFAQDGLDICTNMLQKEIALALKRNYVEEGLHLLCIQVLKPEI